MIGRTITPLLVNAIASAVDHNTSLAFYLSTDVGRDPVPPRNEEKIWVCVADYKPIIAQLVDEIGSATGGIIRGHSDKHLGDDIPTELGISLLTGHRFDFRMNPGENAIVCGEYCLVLLLLILIEIVHVDVSTVFLGVREGKY